MEFKTFYPGFETSSRLLHPAPDLRMLGCKTHLKSRFWKGNALPAANPQRCGTRHGTGRVSANTACDARLIRTRVHFLRTPMCIAKCIAKFVLYRGGFVKGVVCSSVAAGCGMVARWYGDTRWRGVPEQSERTKGAIDKFATILGKRRYRTCCCA